MIRIDWLLHMALSCSGALLLAAWRMDASEGLALAALVGALRELWQVARAWLAARRAASYRSSAALAFRQRVHDSIADVGMNAVGLAIAAFALWRLAVTW